MTTYTITQSEYDQLIKLANKIICVGNGNLPGNSVGNDLGRDVIAMLRNLQPNTQEPVAYLIQPTELSHQSLMKSLHFNKAHARPDWEIIHLYSHPAPQAKPLTDEQIDQCEIAAGVTFRRHQGSVRGQQLTPADNFLYHFARAIEAAHNIGVKP